MLNDSAKITIMPVWLNTDSMNPEWRACCQSYHSQGNTSDTASAGR